MQISAEELKRYLKEHSKHGYEEFQERYAGGDEHRETPHTPVAGNLKGMRCDARTKATGKPCKRNDIYENGRCKLHGGLSTGPRTEAGKKRSSQNGFKKKATEQGHIEV